ncbi:MAG: hypothetical protein Q9163_000218 [Psora crenata]
MHLLPFLPPLLATSLKAHAANDAGIGAEFESVSVTFQNPKCSNENTDAAKNEVVANRKHDTWYLSADTGSEEGKLNAESILDGEMIKAGTGDAAKTGKAVRDDLVTEHPRWGKPSAPAGKFIALVTKEYFQSKPNGIDGDKVSDDVLGFLTLVLSYAKAAKEVLRPDQSPKLFTSFMPRTGSNNIFQQVKSKICGDLFKLLKVLACYKRGPKGLE